MSNITHLNIKELAYKLSYFYELSNLLSYKPIFRKTSHSKNLELFAAYLGYKSFASLPDQIKSDSNFNNFIDRVKKLYPSYDRSDNERLFDFISFLMTNNKCLDNLKTINLTLDDIFPNVKLKPNQSGQMWFAKSSLLAHGLHDLVINLLSFKLLLPNEIDLFIEKSKDIGFLSRVVGLFTNIIQNNSLIIHDYFKFLPGYSSSSSVQHSNTIEAHGFVLMLLSTHSSQ